MRGNRFAVQSNYNDTSPSHEYECKCSKGDPGPPGKNGKPGRNGRSGPPGERGYRGLPGKSGRAGVPGLSVRGERGIQGITGPTGTTGAVANNFSFLDIKLYNTANIPVVSMSTPPLILDGSTGTGNWVIKYQSATKVISSVGIGINETGLLTLYLTSTDTMLSINADTYGALLTQGPYSGYNADPATLGKNVSIGVSSIPLSQIVQNGSTVSVAVKWI